MPAESKIIHSLFWLLLAALIFPVWYFEYFSTVDGPSHLGNSVTISRLLSSECPLVAKFYQFTPGLVPNWIGHFLMAFFSSVMKPLYAEKLLVSLYLLLFSISTLSFLKYINRNSLFLIFPLLIFAYNNLLFTGNYNCLFSIILYLLILKWWLQIRSDLSPKNFSLLIGAFLILYLSHLFGLAAFCLTIGIIYWADFLRGLSLDNFFSVFKRGALTLLALLPTAVAFRSYYILPKIPVAGSFSLLNKISYVLIPSSLYLGGIDDKIVIITACVIWVIIAQVILYRIYQRRQITKNDWPIFIAIALGLIIIFIPSTFGGGWMIEVRLQLLYWLFIILWLAINNFSLNLKFIISAMFILIWGVNYANKLFYFSKYNNILKEFATAKNYIPENSVILTVDISPFTIDYASGETNYRVSVPSITGYLTADKCVAEVANFHAAEANTFPITYREDVNPYLKLGNFRLSNALIYIPPEINIKAYEENTGVKIGYVIIRGKKERMFHYKPEDGLDENALYEKFMGQVNTNFKPIYQSASDLVRVYKAN